MNTITKCLEDTMKEQSRIKPRCPMMFGRLHRDLIEMECLEERCAWWRPLWKQCAMIVLAKRYDAVNVDSFIQVQTDKEDK